MADEVDLIVGKILALDAPAPEEPILDEARVGKLREFAQRNDAPLERGLQVDALKDKINPLDTGELVDTMRRLSLSPLKGTERTSFYVRELNQAGIDTARLADYPFNEQVEAAAAVKLNRLLEEADLRGTGELGAERQILNAFTGMEIASRLPLKDRDRIELATGVGRQLTARMVTRAYEQLSPTPSTKPSGPMEQITLPSGEIFFAESARLLDERDSYRPQGFAPGTVPQEVIKGNMNLAAAAGLLNAMDPSAWDELYKVMLAEARGQAPRSAEEVFLSDPNARSPKLPQRVKALRQLLGPQAAQIFTDEFDRRRPLYLFGRMGVKPETNGNMKPATTEDGFSWGDLLPDGALKALSEARATRGAVQFETDPETVENFQAYARQYGPEFAYRYLKGHMAAALETGARKVTAGLFTGPLALPNLEVLTPQESPLPMTPVEREQMGVVAASTLDALQFAGYAFGGAVDILKRLDSAISSSPGVQRQIQAHAFMVTGDRDMAQEVRTMSEAALLIFRSMIDRSSFWLAFSGVGGEKIPEVIRKNPIFQDLSGTARKELLISTNRPYDFYEKSYGKGERAVAERVARMNAMIYGREPIRIGQFLADTAVVGFHGVTSGIIQPFYMLADDPAAAATMFIGGIAGYRTTKVLRAKAIDLWDNATGMRRIARDLSDVEKHAPFMAKQMRDAIQRQVVNEQNPAAVTAKLRSAAAVMEKAAKDFNRAGAVEAGSFARIADVWPAVEGELGAFGWMVGRTVQRTVPERLRHVFGLLTGKAETRIDGILSATLNSESFDDVARAMKDMLSGGFNSQILRDRIGEFVSSSGRRPNLAEIRNMLPESFGTLNGLLLAAEKHPVASAPMKKAAQELMGWTGTEMMQATLSTADDVMNQMVTTTERWLDAQRAFGLKAKRSDTFFEVAEIKVRQRLEDRDIALRSLDELRQDPQLATLSAVKRTDVLGELERHRNTVVQYINEDTATLNQIRAGRDRLRRHDPEEPWNFPRIFAVEREVDLPTIELILESDSALFGGMTRRDLYDIRMRPPSPAKMAAAKQAETFWMRQFKQAAADEDAILKAPTQHDSKLREMRRRADEVRAEIDRQKKVDGRVAPDLEAELDLLRRSVVLRRRALTQVKAATGRMAEPTDLKGALARRAEAVENHRRALAEMHRLRQGTEETTVNKQGLAQLRQMMRWDGADAELRAGRRRQQELLEGMYGAKLLEQKGNPFQPAALPFHLKGAQMYGMVTGTFHRIAAAFSRIDELSEFRQSLPAREQGLLSMARREGRLPSELMEKYPVLRRYYEGLTGTTRLTRLDQLFQEQGKMIATVLEHNKEAGKLPQHLYDAWRAKGYNPEIWGVFVRPGLIHEKRGREAIAAFAAKGRTVGPGPGALAVQEDAYQLARAFGKYRVRIDEPKLAVEKLFDTPEQAKEFVDARYGAGIYDAARREGAHLRGKTPYNDSFTVSDPLTPEDVELLGGRLDNPLATEVRLKQMMKDMYLDALADNINLYGGYVLDDLQFASLVEKAKAGEMGTVARQFRKMPDIKGVFGNLAGKHVHRSVLAALNRASTTFDSLDSMLRGVRDAFSEGGLQLPSELVAKVPGVLTTIFDTATEASRSALILSSARTWTANGLFNVFLDNLAGGPRLYSVQGLPSLFWSLGQTFPVPKWARTTQLYLGRLLSDDPDVPGAGVLERDPIYLRAKQHGIIGGLFDQELSALKNDMARALLGEGRDRQALVDLYHKRMDVRTRIHEGTLDGNLPTTVALEKELAAIDSAIREADKGITHRFGRWLAGFWINKKDNLGADVNKAMAYLRKGYNFLDEHYKLGKFRELSRVYPEEVAVDMVKKFSQIYSEVPYWVRSIPSPMRAMVVSFPFEAARISYNAMMYRPAHFLGMLSIIPAINLSNFAMSGISWDRMQAILEARGTKNGWSAALDLTTKLHFVNPRTGNLDWEIDFANLLPFQELVRGHGPVRQLMDRWLPPEKRGMLQSLTASGVGLVSNFLLGNPLLNTLTFSMTGRDTRTGELILPKDADPITRTKYTLKALRHSLLPPWAPWGRDWDAFMEAWDAPRSKITGRPYYSQQPFTALQRALTGLGVKGTPADSIGNAMGIGRGRAQPLVDDEALVITTLYKVQGLYSDGQAAEYPAQSTLRELRTFYQRSVDEGFSPESRAEAKKALDEMLQKETEVIFRGLKGKKGRTERQVELELRALAEHGAEGVFSKMPIDAQAMAVALLDQAGVNVRKIADLVDAAVHTASGDLQGEQDPEKVQRAIDYLDQRINRSANVGPGIVAFREHLARFVLPRSEAVRYSEKRLGPVRRELQDRLKSYRRG